MAQMKNYSGRIFGGLLLILLGVILLLDQLGRMDFGYFLGRYWPLILILLGLWQLISHNFRQSGGGWFLVILGTFFLLIKVEILGRSAWHYWPLLLIAAGAWILLKPAFRPSRDGFPEVKEDDLNISAVLSGAKRRVESQNFRGGKATAIMGGVELDFRGARLEGGKATVELTAIMGAVEVRVPKDWKVVTEGNPILGAIEDKHPAGPAEASQVLFVKASVIMGGIEIKD